MTKSYEGLVMILYFGSCLDTEITWLQYQPEATSCIDITVKPTIINVCVLMNIINMLANGGQF